MAYELLAESADQRLVTALAPQLALLAAVRETGNITRAAQRLDVPQPTVSRRLAALAEALGAPVVEHAGRGIRLTRAGEILADASARALVTVETAARQAREEVEPDRGHVVLGFLHLLGRWLVPKLLSGFRARYPGVRFSLVQGSRQHILDQLADGRIDLALVAPRPAEPALDSVALDEQELLLSVPSGHRLAERKHIRFAELADEQFVTLEHGYGLRQIADALCAEAGFEPKIAFEGQESDTVRGLVAAGLGLALLPRFGPRPPSGVAEIPLWPKISRTICLTWHSDRGSTPAVSAFRDYVRSQAAQDVRVLS